MRRRTARRPQRGPKEGGVRERRQLVLAKDRTRGSLPTCPAAKDPRYASEAGAFLPLLIAESGFCLGYMELMRYPQ